MTADGTEGPEVPAGTEEDQDPQGPAPDRPDVEMTVAETAVTDMIGTTAMTEEGETTAEETHLTVSVTHPTVSVIHVIDAIEAGAQRAPVNRKPRSARRNVTTLRTATPSSKQVVTGATER